MGAGFRFAGIEVKGANELREAYSHFHQNRDEKVIIGDIHQTEIVAALHGTHQQRGWLSAGYPCQPWSKLGDRQGTKDQRSDVLRAILECTYLLRPAAVLLECVMEAGRDPKVQCAIKQWGKQAGYHMVHAELHLDALWPNRRSRWWCLLLPPDFPSFSLRGMPAFSEPPAVADLLPLFLSWPDEDMQILTLSRMEKEIFQQCGGLRKATIDLEQPLQTIVHGLACQLSSCPCGCRQQAMSYTRLKERGLIGTLITLRGPTEPQSVDEIHLRHAHPWELSLLVGFPPDQDWNNHLKLGIVAVGQIASPLQACWVVAQFQQELCKLGIDDSWKLPETVLWEAMGQLWTSRNQKCPYHAQHPRTLRYQARCHQLLSQSVLSSQVQSTPSTASPKDIIQELAIVDIKPKPRPSSRLHSTQMPTHLPERLRMEAGGSHPIAREREIKQEIEPRDQTCHSQHAECTLHKP